MGGRMRWQSSLGLANTEPCRVLGHFPDLWGRRFGHVAGPGCWLEGDGARKRYFLFSCSNGHVSPLLGALIRPGALPEQDVQLKFPTAARPAAACEGGHCILRRRMREAGDKRSHRTARGKPACSGGQSGSLPLSRPSAARSLRR